MKKLTKRLIALTVIIAMLTIPTFALASSATQTPVTPVNEIERMADEYVRQLKIYNRRLMLDNNLTSAKRQEIENNIEQVYADLGKIGFRKATAQEVNALSKNDPSNQMRGDIFDDLTSDYENFIIGGPYPDGVNGKKVYYALVYAIPTSGNSRLTIPGLTVIQLDQGTTTQAQFETAYIQTVVGLAGDIIGDVIGDLIPDWITVPMEFLAEAGENPAVIHTFSNYILISDIESTVKYVYVSDDITNFEATCRVTHISNSLEVNETHRIRYFTQYGNHNTTEEVAYTKNSPEYSNAVNYGLQNFATGNTTLDEVSVVKYFYNEQFVCSLSLGGPYPDPYWYDMYN